MGTFSITATVNKINVLSLSFQAFFIRGDEGLCNFPACSHV